MIDSELCSIEEKHNGSNEMLYCHTLSFIAPQSALLSSIISELIQELVIFIFFLIIDACLPRGLPTHLKSYFAAHMPVLYDTCSFAR